MMQSLRTSFSTSASTLFLTLGFLDHRLDDHVDVAEVAVVQRRADLGEHVACLFGRELAALDLLDRSLLASLMPRSKLLVGNVLMTMGVPREADW